MSRACDLVAEVLLILKKYIFDLIIRGRILVWLSKVMSHDFVWSKSAAETMSFSYVSSQFQARYKFLVGDVFSEVLVEAVFASGGLRKQP